MKTIIYGLAVLSASLIAMCEAHSQESFGSAGLEIAIPLGDFAESGANFGIGGSGTYEIGLSDNFAVFGQAGVLFYATDDIETLTIDPNTFEANTTTLDYTLYQIPLQAGAKYYLSEQKEGLYLAGLLGFHITGVSIDGEGDSSTDFSLAPEVGYYLNETISLAMRYQIVTSEGSNLSYLGIRAAYNFE